MKSGPSLGDIYNSNVLNSSSSRALRESELHARVKKLGCSFDAPVTWIQVPVVSSWVEDDFETDNDDDEKQLIREFPVMLPSSLAAWC